LWSRARKRSPHRRRRERKAHFGELVQMDGSFHLWFEDRAPASCLLTLVDDATGTSLGRLGAQETIWGAVGVLRAWIERYGIPQALYTDERTVTIVFAGYNTPQPSNNLGDYRTIGRFQLRFPEGYVSPFDDRD